MEDTARGMDSGRHMIRKSIVDGPLSVAITEPSVAPLENSKIYNVKPLKDILGEDAEKKLNIKLFDAPKFFDKEEEKEEINQVLRKMFDFCPQG